MWSRPTTLCAARSAKKHWSSSSFQELIKARISTADPAPSPLPPQKCQAPAPDFAVPQYKPEPSLVEGASREVLTPASVTPWSLDCFHWSQELPQLNARVFGNEAFKPCQKEIINAVLAGRNVFACMPTGAGKSLLYQLPALVSPGLSVVVMPLIALIKDQVDYLVSKGVRARAFCAASAANEQDQLFAQLNRNEVQVLLTTPEKIAASGALKDLLARKIAEGKVDHLVIDEAHCISTWGTDFRADYLKLADLTAAFPRLPVLCLTSTAPADVREDIISRLGLSSPLCFVTSLNRPNLDYEVLRKNSSVWQDTGKLIKERFPGQSGIVYCLARDECVALAKKLRRQFGVSAEAYHALIPDAERTRVQEEWLKGNLQVVVATIAFGLGINKLDVRFVIHTTLPKSLNDYYQESGRAGRDGASAHSIVFYSYKDKSRIDFLMQSSQRPDITRQYRELSKMIAYCEEKITCRRQMLLTNFGERFTGEECEKRCDNCRLGYRTQEQDVTSVAATVLQAAQTPLTLLQLVQLLTGQGTRDTENPLCGALKDFSQERLRRIINKMCAEEMLEHAPVHSSTLSYTLLRAGSVPLRQLNLRDRIASTAESEPVELIESEEPPTGSLKRPDCPEN